MTAQRPKTKSECMRVADAVFLVNRLKQEATRRTVSGERRRRIERVVSTIERALERSSGPRIRLTQKQQDFVLRETLDLFVWYRDLALNANDGL